MDVISWLIGLLTGALILVLVGIWRRDRSRAGTADHESPGLDGGGTGSLDDSASSHHGHDGHGTGDGADGSGHGSDGGGGGHH